MKSVGNRRLWTLVLSVAAIAPLGLSGALGAEKTVGASVATGPGWGHALSLALRGDFAAARLEIGTSDGGAPVAGRVADWLDQQVELENSRRTLIVTDYDKYVGRAQKWHGRGKIARALGYMLLAYTNADDKETFRQEPWLNALKADALIKAQEHRDKNEWLDAHAIYYELSEVLERDKQLKQWRRECLTRARLEELYKEDSKWEESLEGIDPEMVAEALWRIEQKYVVDADFRKLTESGLREVLLLVQSPAVQGLFESLRDEARRGEFEERLKVRLRQVERAGTMDRRRAVDYFKRMLRINRQTVQLPEALLAAEFMNGSLEELDEFTGMIWPSDYKEFHKHTKGSFIGVGIQIRQKFNTEKDCNEVVVVSPLEDSSAYDAGVQPDDVITKVDGQSLCELKLSLSKVVKMITGPEGTSVTLTVYRPSGKQESDYKLVRKVVKIQSVKGVERDPTDPQRWNFMLDEEMGIGYVRVGAFQENTVGELRKVIAGLKEDRNLRGLILDLRFNPGGLLTSAVDMAEMFLDKDQTIVSTRGLHSEEWPIHSSRDGIFRDLPLILLTNEYSASASEIVSGAIKDHHRGMIVGDRTFGKFSVQNLIQLVRSDAHIKLTTARYYLPSGRCLHRDEDATDWGVNPDVEVKLVPKEIRRVIEMRRNADVLGPRNGDSDETGSASDTSDDAKPATEGPPTPGDKAQEPEAPSSDATGDKPDAKTEDSPEQDGEKDDGAEVADEEEEDEPDPNEFPEVDPQLLTALLMMRLQLVNDQLPIIAHHADTEKAIRPGQKSETAKVISD